MNQGKRRRIGGWAWTAAALLFAWSALQAQGEAFRFRGLLSRVITPNGDHHNDFAIFCVDNPADSEVQGAIYGVTGAKVAELSSGTGLDASSTDCPHDSAVPGGARYLSWDGRSDGQTVHSGVYVYSIKSEGLTFTGTLVVVR